MDTDLSRKKELETKRIKNNKASGADAMVNEIFSIQWLRS